MGLPPSAAAALTGPNAREFSADDFPALGGFGGPDGMGGMNGVQQAVNGGSFFASSSLGRTPGGGQEQASAVAALQHQQQQNQHRANLLGSMNGTLPQTGNTSGQVRNPSGAFADNSDKRVSE